MDVPGIAFITGAASGIGRATAKTFVTDGASGVALVDINPDALRTVKNEIQQLSRSGQPDCRIEIFVADVRSEEQVNAAVNDAVKAFGRIDYALNAAGVGLKHAGGVAFAKTEDWQRVMDINLMGTFLVLRALTQVMLKQEPILSSRDGRPLQRGSIVNIASILGLVGADRTAAYTAAKHGIIGLTRSASEDYAKDGLRINAICPGYTETPMTTKDAMILETMQHRVANSVPMERMGRPEEIADGIVWLCGGRSSFVTGAAVAVDGGYTQR